MQQSAERSVSIPIRDIVLEGDLTVPEGTGRIVLFAHGSGSSRKSPRNRMVAGILNDAGIATLLFDLLTADEEVADQQTQHLRFDIGLLAERLAGATLWLLDEPVLQDFSLGYFGASTGAGAALVAAAGLPDSIQAVVSRGGRPDLAGAALPKVKAPTLLIVGGHDQVVIGMNRDAMHQMQAQVHLEIIEGATHLFEEPGALEAVAELARDWFLEHLRG